MPPPPPGGGRHRIAGLGKFADLIVLDRDILSCDVYDIGDTQVLLTLLGGKEVHRAEAFS